MKKVGVAILGLGTVGSNVFKILLENQTYFEKEYEIQVDVCMVYVRDIYKKRAVSLEGVEVTDDIEKIIHNAKVDVCIECMGGNGTEATFDYIMRLIAAKKHVILSSKKCLALYKNEIIENVNKHEVQLRYDATVGGSIPICKVFQNLSGYDSVNKIYGIANATTNYILTLMKSEGISYDEALKMAKEAGYAENNASNDVDGWDALYKMCILLRFGAGIDVPVAQMKPQCLAEMSDILLEEPDASIKQIFYARSLSEDKIGYYVGPVAVKKNLILRDVEGQNNIIFVEHKYGGVRAYYGKGAGGRETAAIMVEDLFDAIWHDVKPKAVSRHVSVERIEREEIA